MEINTLPKKILLVPRVRVLYSGCRKASNMTITKEEFDSLYSDTITKKNYDEIIAKIETRFIEICGKIVRKTDKYRGWFDYGNCGYDGDESRGYFDPKRYRNYVEIGGEWINLIEPLAEDFDLCFPTKWLWEDFEAEVATITQNYKTIVAQRRKEHTAATKQRKAEIAKLKASIKKKLSAKELKIVKFIEL